LLTVRSVCADISKSVPGGDADQMGLELFRRDLGDSIGRVRRRLEGKQIGEETTDMWRGHRGAGDGVGGILASNPGGENVQAGCEDISALNHC